MELVFIFAIVFVQMFFINAGEVMQIEGALRVDAFVDAEELPALFWDKGVPAIRTHEPNGRGNHLSRDERLATDLALVLSVPDIVIVEIVVRCPTKRTEGIFRDGFTIAALNGSDGFAVLPEIVFKEKLPVLFDERLEEREGVGSKLLVFRGVGTIKGPLLEWNIFADKVQEPADSFVLFLNYSE